MSFNVQDRTWLPTVLSLPVPVTLPPHELDGRTHLLQAVRERIAVSRFHNAYSKIYLRFLAIDGHGRVSWTCWNHDLFRHSVA